MLNRGILWLCYLLFIFGAFFEACRPATSKQNFIKPYFDLRVYFFKREEAFLKQKRYMVKTIRSEGQIQRRTLLKPDWIREMVFFQEADLNKPAWFGKYKVEEKLGKLRYTAMDTEKIAIREVVFYNFNSRDSSFDSLKMVKDQNNFFSHIHSVLMYKPDSFYSIAYFQKIRLYKANSYDLRVQIKPQFLGSSH